MATTATGPLPAMVAPRQERSQASTQRLLDAGTELFVERGYAATTLAAIGDRAGYSRGIVTMRFGSKERLAWAVVARAARQWEAVLAAPGAAADGLGEVCGFIAVSRDNMVEQPTARLVLERLYAESAAPLAPLHDRFEENLGTLVASVAAMARRGIADGSIRADVDVEVFAALLVAQLRGIGYQWFLFPTRVDPVAHHGMLTGQVVAFLAPVGATP